MSRGSIELMDLRELRRKKAVRVSGVVFFCTCVLTLDFLGVLSSIDSESTGMQDRFPYYFLAASVGFVTALFYLEAEFSRGIQTIIPAVGIGVVTFLAVGFGVEGVLFAFASPEKVFTRNLLIYILSAGVVSTGLGYWLLQHWREFFGKATI